MDTKKVQEGSSTPDPKTSVVVERKREEVEGGGEGSEVATLEEAYEASWRMMETKQANRIKGVFLRMRQQYQGLWRTPKQTWMSGRSLLF